MDCREPRAGFLESNLYPTRLLIWIEVVLRFVWHLLDPLHSLMLNKPSPYVPQTFLLRITVWRVCTNDFNFYFDRFPFCAGCPSKQAYSSVFNCKWLAGQFGAIWAISGQFRVLSELCDIFINGGPAEFCFGQICHKTHSFYRR